MLNETNSPIILPSAPGARNESSGDDPNPEACVARRVVRDSGFVDQISLVRSEEIWGKETGVGTQMCALSRRAGNTSVRNM